MNRDTSIQSGGYLLDFGTSLHRFKECTGEKSEAASVAGDWWIVGMRTEFDCCDLQFRSWLWIHEVGSDAVNKYSMKVYIFNF